MNKIFKEHLGKYLIPLKVLFFGFIVLISVFAASKIDVYILKCDLGDIIVKKEYEIVYTRFINGLYDNLHDFSVNENIITSTSNDPHIYLNTENVGYVKYLSLDVDLLGRESLYSQYYYVPAYGGIGYINEDDSFHYMLKDGVNYIKLPVNNLKEFRLDITNEEGVSLIVNNVKLTNKKIPENKDVITFILLIFLWCSFWLLILINKNTIIKIVNIITKLKEIIVFIFLNIFNRIPKLNILFNNNISQKQSNIVIINLKNIFTWVLSKPYIFLTLIVVTQILTILYFTDQKKGFHLDEIYSHVQANGNLNGTQARNDIDMHDKWNNAEYYYNFLTVQKNERFDFKSVYNTISRNVHPPFYHMQLHAIYSFFPDVFSKWISVIINIFWLTLTSILLYFLSLQIFKDKIISLFPSAVWSVCNGAITNAIFFRMYATQTFFFTSIILLSVFLMNKNNNKELKYLIFLFISLFFCLFTHNYSIILITFVITLLFIYLYYIKEYKKLCKIIFIFVLSLMVFYFTWPYVIRQIFFSSRGTQAFDNIQVLENYGSKIKNIFNIINIDIFNNILPINIISLNFILFLIFLFIIISIIIIKNRNFKYYIDFFLKENIFKLIFIFTVSFLFLIIIAIIAPYSRRYILPIYPIIVLFALSIFYFLFFKSTRITKNLIMFILSLFLIIGNFSNRNVEQLYSTTPDITKILSNFEKTSCIALFSNQLETTFFDFTQFNRTYICRSIEKIEYAINGIEQGQELFIYLSDNLDKDIIFEILSDGLQFDNAEILFSHRGRDVYHINW